MTQSHSHSISLITSFFISLFIFLLTNIPSLISAQTCQRTCGKQILKFPFGSDPGCGDPRFQQYVTCNQQNLVLTTHTGSYPVTAIDYAKQVIYITDPSMSTCSCTQPSKGFGLDWDAPFTFHDDTIFALLDCSISSSPIYTLDGLYADGNNSKVPLCDNEGTPICSVLYSCRPIITINLPISACCIYTPVDLGPAFEMDLKKLQCTSYSGFYSFNGQETKPENWKYGIALKYKFNVNNEYPGLCSRCESSYGVCGFTGSYNSFICNCPNGVNTPTDCFFKASYNNGLKLLPWKNYWALLKYFLAWPVVWFLF
ncbi:hypothetical protein I3842_05G139400 [Carya illinoinensis]|uniref:non-specific serine/threonine protein kinase n=1 Tax=Carya illinoinensis TaxID=32201 RepID=A0A922JLT4_CARIL|nr:hypothetical protein I3842_05G139400 [Carya illinoinensis]